jgi:ABC-type dipeptide/oligopeptide/nickel transport system ATPase component
VGRSGAGKTTFWRAVLQLLPENAKWSGRIELPGDISLGVHPEEMRMYRRRSVGVIFQDPVGSLVPNSSIGHQLVNAIAFRSGSPRRQAEEQARHALHEVGLPDVDRVMRSLPGELSGGMCQRVMISLALAAPGPLRLLIADEPLTALDALSAAQVLESLLRAHRAHSGNLIFITHDLRVAQRFDWIAVFSNGRLTECARTSQFFSSPISAEGRELLAASLALSLQDHEFTTRIVGDSQ